MFKQFAERSEKCNKRQKLHSRREMRSSCNGETQFEHKTP